MAQDTGGPYLNAALICERVLREVDGVFSPIRIFDRLTVSAPDGGLLPSDAPRPPMKLTLFISFRSGAARGQDYVTLRVERPDGLMRDLQVVPILFEGDERAANIVLELITAFELDGLYWFCVELNNRLVTKMPLRIVTQSQPPALSPVD